MMTQFMKDIPDSLIEAAKIDGCSNYGTFFKIVLPITVPQLSLLAIFNFTQQWGSLTWPLITVNETMMENPSPGHCVHEGFKWYTDRNYNGSIHDKFYTSAYCIYFCK